MNIRQTIIVLNTIMRNPGLNYQELETMIEKIYGKENEAVQFMFLGDTDENSHLRVLIKAIYCVEKKDDRYYYNSNLPLTDKGEYYSAFYRKLFSKQRTKKETR